MPTLVRTTYTQSLASYAQHFAHSHHKDQASEQMIMWLTLRASYWNLDVNQTPNMRVMDSVLFTKNVSAWSDLFSKGILGWNLEAVKCFSTKLNKWIWYWRRNISLIFSQTRRHKFREYDSLAIFTVLFKTRGWPRGSC